MKFMWFQQRYFFECRNSYSKKFYYVKNNLQILLNSIHIVSLRTSSDPSGRLEQKIRNEANFE